MKIKKHTVRWMPAGSIRKDNYYGYLWEKVENHPEFGTGWVKVHHIVWWRKYKQRIPKGWVLHHEDEDKENNKISNLELIRRGPHLRHHFEGFKKTARTKHLQSEAARKRCTPAWRAAVSKRVKIQWKGPIIHRPVQSRSRYAGT